MKFTWLGHLRFKNYFMFNRAERNGFIVLLVLIGFVILLPWIYGFIIKPVLINEQELDAQVKKYFSKNQLTFHQKGDSLFKFNPNSISSAQFRLLGLSPYQVKMILKYRAKGGAFKKKEDVRKIYSISEDDYQRLKPYIELSNDGFSSRQVNAKVKILIEINSADSLQLLSLNGIGTVFAGRILKYRNMLGGFYEKRQLSEVYGLNQTKLTQCLTSIIIDTTRIKKINLNVATFKELMKHPYIGYDNAKKILNYKRKEGRILQISELAEKNVIQADTYHKLLPYIISN